MLAITDIYWNVLTCTDTYWQPIITNSPNSQNGLQQKEKNNMTEDFSPKALVVVERLLEVLG